MRDFGSENRSTIARRAHRSVALDSQHFETGAKKSISVSCPKPRASLAPCHWTPADKQCVIRNRTLGQAQNRPIANRTLIHP